MKPPVFEVADSLRGLRHRSFAKEQAAFCGRVGRGQFRPGGQYLWLIQFNRIGLRENVSAHKVCRACQKSPLNGHVVLVDNHYKPVVDLALEAGQAAFAKGIACAPALDPAMSKLLKGTGNDCLPVLKAWHRGWATANLAVPVVEL